MKSPRESIIAKGSAPNASESAIQTLFFLMLNDLANERNDARLRFIHAVPNGGTRDRISAAVMVGEGVRAGVWDVCIPFPSGRFPFGYIEFKRPQVSGHKHGGLTDSQVEFGRHLISVKAWYAVCYSAEDAINRVKAYLAGER